MAEFQAAKVLERLMAELEKVKRERDAAIDDLRDAIEHGDGLNFCHYCKHNNIDGQCVQPCNAYAGESGWEWRGV